ncbi:MAG: BON domain-containing protein [Zoogloeaceae bacterium]|jgi:osmotically-inducible protein OsmY|nr:BON domain-containing protein [Zoogloeaceae bacterium]
MQNHVVRRFSFLLWFFLLVPFLQGCFGVALVGVTTGAMAVTDRRSLGVQADDAAIELKAGNRLSKALRDASHLNVTSYNRRVLLTGEVPNAASKTQAEEEIRRIENVTDVLNELVIAGNSSLIARSGDTVVTSKVKARFVDANEFSAHHVKVVTEAGAVFLLGLVNRREAEAAIRVARHTSGVSKVVNWLQILSDAEIQRIDASLANSANSASGR